MLDITQDTRAQQGTAAPESGLDGSKSDIRESGSGPLLPFWEVAAAAKAVSIAQEQERQVGSKRTNTGGHPQKYFLSDEGRALILARYDSRTETITWLVEQLSTPENTLPRWQIRKWAKDLGIARLKELPWSEEEVAYLRNCLHRYGLARIAKDLGRTETSIKVKATRLGIRKLVTGDGFTMRAICRGLGVDHHQVELWLWNKWFWGERRESRRHSGQKGDIWYFTEEAIRFLVRQHPEEIDLRRVDPHWFIEVLLGPPQEKDQRPTPPLPPRAARSAYAYISDEAHTLLVAHYTGGLRRTEALAEVLGVTPDEVTTWAVLLGLEQPSLHHPRVHQQAGRNQSSSTGTRHNTSHHLSQSVRHLLEERFDGDPGATQALADDLGLSVEEVFALARKAGIKAARHSSNDAGDGPTRARGTRRTAADEHSQAIPSVDPIPLQAQLLVATRYNEAEGTVEQLAEELTRLLDPPLAPVTVTQVHEWARRLGLRVRRSRVSTRSTGEQSGRASRTTAALVPLQLDAGEWGRFLSADAGMIGHLTSAASDLPTVEEIRLGYQVHLGMLERRKDAARRDTSVIEAAQQAEARLAEALLPLVFTQALTRLGRGVALEALLAAGRRGLDRAICSFDYTQACPLISSSLPAINEEMGRLIEHTTTTFPASRRTNQGRLFARIAQESCRLSREIGHPPTLEAIAGALSLPEDQVEKTVVFLVKAERLETEPGTTQRRRSANLSEEQFIAAFLKTHGQRSGAIIKELAEILPLTPLTIQVKFYALRLHTRLSERECARAAQRGGEASTHQEPSGSPLGTAALEQLSPPPAVMAEHAQRDDRQTSGKRQAAACRAVGTFHLLVGHFLWDVVIDGQKQRWTLDVPYGQLADTAPTGTHLLFKGETYRAERVHYNILVVSRVETAEIPTT